MVGGTVLDVIFRRVPRLPGWPRHQESTRRNLVQAAVAPIVTLGGNGANAAYVVARSGVSVTLHTAFGDDAFGCLAKNWLETAGCRIRLSRQSGATAVNVVAANARLARAMLFFPGTAPSLPPATAVPPGPGHVLVCGWPHPPLGRVARFFGRLRRRGITTVLDAGPILDRPWTRQALRPVFRHLDLLLANEYEVLRITGARDLSAALKRLRRDFSGDLVVKRGAGGALWLPAGAAVPRSVAGHRVRAVNSVGAGDSFNGALLAALARGAPFPAAIRVACGVAASVVRSPRGVLGVEPASV